MLLINLSDKFLEVVYIMLVVAVAVCKIMVVVEEMERLED
tara:strand:+ start:526 stop:645 length:120 start_codon:yes stop_codon:yes gene_type:complete